MTVFKNLPGTEDQERDVMQIREHIAKAIYEADNTPCPEGYSESAGFGEHDWLSDWGAFLADHIKSSLDDAGFVIVPKYRCDNCGKSFNSAKDKQRHRMDKHTPHRKLSSKDRPADLGPVPCGYPECNQSFATEYNASQHRRDVHDETECAAERVRAAVAEKGGE